ncbi:MAG: hypothetical protein H7Z42_20990 [Roseiflexaceae bacterium]|nr:hypothetical protein [Roseiflexaceae bacterium]
MHTMLLAPVREAPPAATLQIALFGSPQLHTGQQVLALPRKQLRAVVFRLASSSQPVAREQLCFLLWPDTPEATARRYLTVLLNQLRQALPIPELLLAQHDAIQLDHAQASVDTIVFSQAISAAPASRNMTQLAQAVDLYSGPFLDGFSLPASLEFDSWAEQERRSWERRYLDALALLVDAYTAQREYGQAIEVAERALAADELAEEMHRRLIELYDLFGDRSRALRQFERCVLVLERELGVSPLPETRELYESVRDGRATEPPMRAMSGRALAVPAAPPPGGAPKTHPTLPVAPTPLIGRAELLAQADAMLIDPTVRLLTLCGPGGSGKTRLGLQIAWDIADLFAHGAVFVALAPLRDPAFVVQAVAQACGLKQDSLAALSEYLREKHMLLVLDNCEHLVTAGPQIAALLAAAPDLHILATSRAALHVQGEHTLVVPPLPLPDLAHLPENALLATIPSMALLLARTHAVNARFQLNDENAAELAEICVRLDGLPLAIELAAARLKLLAPRDMLRRLDRRLAVLTNGARDLPNRQQTLRAMIDWSYRLLDHDEQVWFERCGVFVGSWSLATVESLHERLGHADTSALDLMSALADKSLIEVITSDDGDVRFRMLETIREFAAEQLHQRGSPDATHQAHADAFLALVEPWDFNVPEWLANVERELGNLRVALRWYLNHDGEADRALALSLVLARFWYWRDWISEGRWWLEQVIAHSAQVRSAARADAVNWTGLFATVAGDPSAALELYQEALQLARDLSLLKPRANALLGLGTIHSRQGDAACAKAALEESLAVARQIALPIQVSNACYMLANILISQGGDIERGIALYEECLVITRQHNMKIVESMALSALGQVLALTGDLARADALLTQAFRQQREMNATMAIGWTLLYFGLLRYQQAQYQQAAQHFLESLDEAPQGGAHSIAPAALEGIAGVLSMQLQPERAARLLGTAEALRETGPVARSLLEQPLYERILTSVRAQLAAHAIAAAWQSGRGLSAEQAIAEARTWVQRPRA